MKLKNILTGVILGLVSNSPGFAEEIKNTVDENSSKVLIIIEQDNKQNAPLEILDSEIFWRCDIKWWEWACVAEPKERKLESDIDIFELWNEIKQEKVWN